ncbi:MAG: hypothetical protein AAFU68_00205 [Pseudomonadota bacterium]
MTVITLLASAFLATSAMATDQQQAEAPRLDGWQGERPKVDCQCRRPGGAKAELGERICVQRGDRMVTMQCELALNNTIWKEIADECEPLS